MQRQLTDYLISEGRARSGDSGFVNLCRHMCMCLVCGHMCICLVCGHMCVCLVCGCMCVCLVCALLSWGLSSALSQLVWGRGGGSGGDNERYWHELASVRRELSHGQIPYDCFFLNLQLFLTSQVIDKSPHAVMISVSLNMKPLSVFSVVCLSVTTSYLW